MNQAASAYARTSQAAMSPRELEAAVLLKAANKLQAVREDWDGKRSALGDALQFNRTLWTILVTSVTTQDSPVPAEVRQRIVDLGMFTFNRTVAVLLEPEASKLAVLVNINRELAAGLRGSAAAAA